MNKGRKIVTGIAIVMLICGIGVFFYPHISQYFFQKQADRAIDMFQGAVTEVREKEER